MCCVLSMNPECVHVHVPCAYSTTPLQDLQVCACVGGGWGYCIVCELWWGEVGERVRLADVASALLMASFYPLAAGVLPVLSYVCLSHTTRMHTDQQRVLCQCMSSAAHSYMLARITLFRTCLCARDPTECVAPCTAVSCTLHASAWDAQYPAHPCTAVSCTLHAIAPTT